MVSAVAGVGVGRVEVILQKIGKKIKRGYSGYNKDMNTA